MWSPVHYGTAVVKITPTLQKLWWFIGLVDMDDRSDLHTKKRLIMLMALKYVFK